jgi:hypothetical protein
LFHENSTCLVACVIKTNFGDKHKAFHNINFFFI